VTSGPTQSLLETVRADIASREAQISELQRQLTPLLAEVDKLRYVESYLLSKLPPAVHVQPTHPATVGSQGQNPADVPAHVIDGKAAELLRNLGPGKVTRARDIALHILPGYDPESDERNFENRIFSHIKRRPEKFVKVGRGMWALREFVEKHPDLYPQEEEELAVHELAAG